MVSTEQQLFFGPPDARRFGVLHTPSTSATTPWSVLVLAPIAHENGFAHRTMVELARALAGAGAHVFRFDYRGHGDSVGNFEDFTIESLDEDVTLALAELERLTGASCRVMLGMRFGATLAMRAAAKLERPPMLVLWEPIAQGDKYLDEVLRVVMSKDVAHAEGGKPRTRTELRKVMADGGQVLLEGHALTAAWYRSLMAVDVYKEGTSPKARTLILQLPQSKSGNVRKDLEQLKAHLAAGGQAVDLEVVPSLALWWGPLTREFDARNRPKVVFDATIAWLRKALEETRAASANGHHAPAARTTTTSAAGERLLGIHVDGQTIPAVLHEAKSDGPKRPVAIMLVQGMNRRTGWNRLYVRIARTLAARGIPTLRFDARGFGDAPGVVELATGEDVFVAVQKGLHLPETRAAIAESERLLGPRPVILLGICGGAVTAGLLTHEDPRVVGAAFVETELTYTTLLPDEEPEYRVFDKLKDPKRWLKLLSLKADYRKHARSAVRIIEKRVRAKLGRPRAVDDLGWLATELGPTVNMPLFQGFVRTFERGIPMLFTFGATENQKAFDTVKTRLLATSKKTRRFVKEVPIVGADHDFLTPESSGALIELLAGWIRDPAQPWADPTMPAVHATTSSSGGEAHVAPRAHHS